MASFVLVHGAWHGGWCWRYVREPLLDAGHRVFTPSLTGLGDRCHLAGPDNDLETHVNDIVNLIAFEELEDVVLCGHSYAGLVITHVADRVGDRLKALVYLDGFIPKGAESEADFLGADYFQRYIEAAEREGEGWAMPAVPAAKLGVTDPERAAWIDRHCTPMALRCFQQGLPQSGGAWRVPRRHCVVTRDHPGEHFRRLAERCRREGGWTVIELPCGHDAMAILPERLARILTEAAS